MSAGEENKMMGIRICPKCGSDNVQMAAGGIIGMWICKNCGFSGSIFPEKPILGSEEEMEGDIKDKIKIRKIRRKK